jgi:hypothetical protein
MPFEMANGQFPMTNEFQMLNVQRSNYSKHSAFASVIRISFIRHQALLIAHFTSSLVI